MVGKLGATAYELIAARAKAKRLAATCALLQAKCKRILLICFSSLSHKRVDIVAIEAMCVVCKSNERDSICTPCLHFV